MHSKKSALDSMAQRTDTWCTLPVVVRMHVCMVVYVCFGSVKFSLVRQAAAHKYTSQPLTCWNKSQKCFPRFESVHFQCNTPSMLHQGNHHRFNDQPGSHLESCVCCLCVLNDLAVDPDAFEN